MLEIHRPRLLRNTCICVLRTICIQARDDQDAPGHRCHSPPIPASVSCTEYDAAIFLSYYYGYGESMKCDTARAGACPQLIDQGSVVLLFFERPSATLIWFPSLFFKSPEISLHTFPQLVQTFLLRICPQSFAVPGWFCSALFLLTSPVPVSHCPQRVDFNHGGVGEERERGRLRWPDHV